MARRKKAAPKNRVYKRGGSLKKASRGTGAPLKKAFLGDVGNWLDDKIINPVVGGIKDIGTGIYDTGAGIYDYLGDADRFYITGDQDAFGWQETPDMTYNEAINQRRPDFLKTETGERHSVNPNQSTNINYTDRNKNKKNTSSSSSSTTSPDTNWRGVPQTQMTDAQYNQMMIDKRAGKRYGGTKRYKYGGEGHVVPGKFLRRGPKR
jgi:hypothetical protein